MQDIFTKYFSDCTCLCTLVSWILLLLATFFTRFFTSRGLTVFFRGFWKTAGLLGAVKGREAIFKEFPFKQNTSMFHGKLKKRRRSEFCWINLETSHHRSPQAFTKKCIFPPFRIGLCHFRNETKHEIIWWINKPINLTCVFICFEFRAVLMCLTFYRTSDKI